MGSREKWLLSMLTGIFCIQAGILIYGVRVCSNITPQQNIKTICPELGERFDLTFGTMIATTLALLTGSSLALAQGKEKDKSKAPPYTPPPPGRQ
jgi:hypothetical protein